MAVDSEQILAHIPYLRRHARLLTGSREVGDEYVRICLELVMAEPERLEGEDLRVALYKAFYAAWSSFNKVDLDSPDEAVSREERLEQGLAALPAVERLVLLLVVVEELAIEDAARVLDLSLDGARDHLARARTNLRQEVELPVLIIEDEPMIAMELAQIVREMGLRVATIAARQGDAVMAAGSGETTEVGLVLADIQLQGGGDGIVAAQAILERYDVPIVFVTGFPERLLTGNGLEPAFVAAKPFEAESLKVTIAHALSIYAKAVEAVEHRAKLLAKLRQITARRGADSQA